MSLDYFTMQNCINTGAQEQHLEEITSYIQIIYIT